VTAGVGDIAALKRGWSVGCGESAMRSSDADVELARELHIRQTTVYRGVAARLAHAEFERSCPGVDNKFFVEGG